MKYLKIERINYIIYYKNNQKMIDIIGHFFILYPIISFNKFSNLLGGKTNIQKFLINCLILSIAAVLTNFYLMDSNLIYSDRREQNLYEIL